MKQMAQCSSVSVSQQCQTPRGPLHVRDVVRVSVQPYLGKVSLLLQTTCVASEDRFWAILAPFSQLHAESVWSAAPQPEVIVELDLVSAPLCYATVVGRIVV
jgi:hypothetical protein